MIGNIDINKKVVSDKVSFDEKDFKYFFGYKGVKKVDVHAYFSPKRVYIEKIFIKLNVYLFS